jgi:DNA (cytosine-5)-methyltransferase 1
MSGARPLTVLSLYCGAGGLDHGFKKAGFDLAAAIDADPVAVSTYRANVGPDVVCGDVAAVGGTLPGSPDLIIGGPPCQGFSVMGKMDRDDPRSRHVGYFMDVVEAKRPRAFVMENVKALATSSRWRSVREGLEVRARNLGFRVRVLVLDASQYEVPQVRERMFMVGLMGVDPHLPEPKTAGEPSTVRGALARLAPYGEKGNDDFVVARIVPAKRPVMRPSPFRGSLIFNGSGRPLSLDRPARTLPASMGGNATPIIDQRELLEGADPWVSEYHSHLLRGGRPRTSVPNYLRRITVQEAAALQSFPGTWTFEGSQVARLRQIGNAVPPVLAYHVALSVKRSLRSADSPPMLSEPRRLLATEAA